MKTPNPSASATPPLTSFSSMSSEGIWEVRGGRCPARRRQLPPSLLAHRAIGAPRRLQMVEQCAPEVPRGVGLLEAADARVVASVCHLAGDNAAAPGWCGEFGSRCSHRSLMPTAIGAGAGCVAAPCSNDRMTIALGPRRNQSNARNYRNNAQIKAREPMPHSKDAVYWKSSLQMSLEKRARCRTPLVRARAKEVAGQRIGRHSAPTGDDLKGTSYAQFAGRFTAGTTTRRGDRSL